jgi:uncharacterized protein YuzE
MVRTLVITLEATEAEPTTTAPTDCVLDVNGLGDVIGVEIVNLAHNTGQRAPGSRGLATLCSGERIGWSYDQEADAFYVTITEDRSIDQRSARCSVGGTRNGRLTSVTVEWNERRGL